MKPLSGLILLVLVFSCSHTHHLQKTHFSESAIDTELKANMDFLASDALEGRETTKRGARIAAEYIASQLKQYGVKPLGDDNSYFQNFKLYRSKIANDSRVYFSQEDTVFNNFKVDDSFLVYTAGDSLSAHAENELIFVGYGISDSSYNYDDYAGLDVTGKTVVFLSGEPSIEGDSLFFNGKKPTRWMRSQNKRKLALQKGAAGAILLLDKKWVNKWQSVQNWLGGEDYDLELPETTSIPSIVVDSLFAKALFQSDKNYVDLLLELQENIAKKTYAFPFKINFDINVEVTIADARNVVGIVEGTDPSLKNEIVTIGAHYDHLGIRNGKIYNGADDNGSGTVAIMESARYMAAIKPNKRPVVYVFHTAEEKGLLGAYYFSDNFDKIDNVIVNLNMDMVGREHEDTLFVVGSGKLSGELFEIVENANKETTRFVFDYTYDDPKHPSRIYYRSDHWAFAKKGIPVTFLTDMHGADYHRTSDDAHKINYKKLKKVVTLTNEIALRVANLDHKLVVDNANYSGTNKK